MCRMYTKETVLRKKEPREEIRWWKSAEGSVELSFCCGVGAHDTTKYSQGNLVSQLAQDLDLEMMFICQGSSRGHPVCTSL